MVVNPAFSARIATIGARAVPRPGPHGGDGAQLAAAFGLDPGSILDLSASLNPVAPDPGEVVAKHLDALRGLIGRDNPAP